LNAAKITYDENNLMNPWQFDCSIVNKNFKECGVKFIPAAIKKKAANFGIIMSDLNVVFGEFEGWVSDGRGIKTHFSEISGYCEVHKARW